MSEVAIRRTFLDRRACLESNSKVEYEKQQEVSCFGIIRQTLGKSQENIMQRFRLTEFNIKEL
jgi:hypothetical protein